MSSPAPIAKREKRLAADTEKRTPTRLDQLQRWGVPKAKRFYAFALGDVFRHLGVIALALIPVLKDFNVVKSTGWMVGWLVLFLLKAYVWDRYLNGLFADATGTRLAEINASLAGNLDRITLKLVSNPDRRLSEEGSKALCVGLMHRVKDYVVLAMGTRPDVRFRVDLAVPLPVGPLEHCQSLRVWCYDESYGDSRWSEFDIDRNRPLPGSPTAFVTGTVQIISDIQDIPEADGIQRRFRSVLSIPVKAGGPGGRTLAIMNIDATQPGLFTAELVEDSILPLVQTVVNMIALVLLNRREGVAYAFDS